MIGVVHRKEHILVEHFLRGIGSAPEVDQDHLRIQAAETHLGSVDRRKFQFRIGHFGRLADALTQVQKSESAVRFLTQRLDIAGSRINGQERIIGVLEMNRIRGLAEYREIRIDLLIQHRNGRDGFPVLHHIYDPGTIILDVLSGSERIVPQRIPETLHEVAEIPFDLLKFEALLGTFDRIVAECIGNHFHPIPLFEQHGSELRLPFVEIDKFGFAFPDFQPIGVGSVRSGLDRVDDIIGRGCELLHDDLGIGGAGQHSFNLGFRRTGSRTDAKGSKGREANLVFHGPTVS